MKQIEIDFNTPVNRVKQRHEHSFYKKIPTSIFKQGKWFNVPAPVQTPEQYYYWFQHMEKHKWEIV